MHFCKFLNSMFQAQFQNYLRIVTLAIVSRWFCCSSLRSSLVLSSSCCKCFSLSFKVTSSWMLACRRKSFSSLCARSWKETQKIATLFLTWNIDESISSMLAENSKKRWSLRNFEKQFQENHPHSKVKCNSERKIINYFSFIFFCKNLTRFSELQYFFIRIMLIINFLSTAFNEQLSSYYSCHKI